MDLILRLVLAILGTCILLYLNWLIYLLHSHPWALWKINNHRYFSASGNPVTLLDKVHQKLTYLKIVMISSCACFAAYQIAYWCLGWIPDDWGKVDEYGDWVTFRSSLSVIFSIYGGLFFLEGVGRGVSGRVAKDTYQAEAILRDQIDDANSVEELIKLKDKFELAINKGARALSERNTDIYSKFADIFPDQIYEREVLSNASNLINKRLVTLQLMGVNVQKQLDVDLS